ncbi:MAG: Arginine--tRNA ligase [Microgenomates bacterium OLB22]|nr:MAG: Arginine--tRNA ligase [Microgenomates bacterium OLB22]
MIPREKIEKAVSDVVGLIAVKLLKPRRQLREYGGYCFHLKSVQGSLMTPDEIRTKLAKRKDLFRAVTRDGDFINLLVSDTFLIDELSGLHKEFLPSSETWLIEHTSPNPNKAMHLGHLRNNILGTAISNLWQKIGIAVKRDCVDNNRGIAIAKLMWGYLKFARKDPATPISIEQWYTHPESWRLPTDTEQDPGKFIEGLYTQAHEDCETNEESEQSVRQMVVDWEHENPKVWALWKLVLSFSYQSQEKTYARLGSHFDKVWHEHEHYKEGKKYVEEGLKKGLFIKTDEGTVITQLESYGLSNAVIMKSDGTSLYITQDIALTDLKNKTFKPARLFWTVGSEQSLALQQVFAVCDQLEIVKKEQCTHLSYGLISIKGHGKMSSRKGNVVFIDDLIDEVKEKIIGSRTAVDGGRLDDSLAESLALGAIKYSILKVSRDSNIAFDIEDSINFEGNSGPYLQYTHARMRSILRKSPLKEAEMSTIEDITRGGYELPEHLSSFKDTLIDAATTNSPHLLCAYAYELTRVFNAFYEKHHVLKAEEHSRNTLLALVKISADVLKECLILLGIDPPETV